MSQTSAETIETVPCPEIPESTQTRRPFRISTTRGSLTLPSNGGMRIFDCERIPRDTTMYILNLQSRVRFEATLFRCNESQFEVQIETRQDLSSLKSYIRDAAKAAKEHLTFPSFQRSRENPTPFTLEECKVVDKVLDTDANSKLTFKKKGNQGLSRVLQAYKRRERPDIAIILKGVCVVIDEDACTGRFYPLFDVDVVVERREAREESI